LEELGRRATRANASGTTRDSTRDAETRDRFDAHLHRAVISSRVYGRENGRIPRAIAPSAAPASTASRSRKSSPTGKSSSFAPRTGAGAASFAAGAAAGGAGAAVDATAAAASVMVPLSTPLPCATREGMNDHDDDLGGEASDEILCSPGRPSGTCHAASLSKKNARNGRRDDRDFLGTVANIRPTVHRTARARAATARVPSPCPSRPRPRSADDREEERG
jgi:hypothetical protein